MTRKILFRGKSIKTGCWVEGYYFYDKAYDAHFILTGHVSTLSYGFVTSPIEVDPETVGQWWDLPNIKNKGVFEGDIVECGEHRGVVKLVGIRLEPFDYLSGIDIGHGVRPRYTPDTLVIGTRWDNPDLLEESNGGN